MQMTTQAALELAIKAFNDCRRIAAGSHEFGEKGNAILHDANDELHRLLDATKRGECIIPIHAIGKGRSVDVAPPRVGSPVNETENHSHQESPGLQLEPVHEHAGSNVTFAQPQLATKAAAL